MKITRNFLSSGKGMLSSVLVATSLFACSKKEVQPSATLDASNTVAAAAAASGGGLFIDETMESAHPFANANSIENCGLDWTYSFPSLAFAGNKSVRFEIRKNQPLVGSSHRIRSEVTVIRGSEWPGFSKEAWYSFAVYFPSVGFEPDDTRDCINQWFEDGSDETTLRCQSDKAFLEVTPPSGSTSLKKYDLFGAESQGGNAGGISDFVKIPKDQWHEFVFHFIHSTGSDGLIEVWRDGKKIHTISGRNMHLIIPKWKIGLYKASFLNGSSSRSSRVLYFDNVRVGGPSATLASMLSGNVPVTPPPVTDTTGTTPTTPTTPTNPPASGQKVVSFTLVNSANEKDVMTLAEGAKLSLKKLNGRKFNVRANLADGTAALVKMDLTGAASQSTADDQAPYALFGDVAGNYKSWTAKTGRYSLKAAAFGGTLAQPGAALGAEYKISFSIEK
ncbi:polysaccharide lyase [Paraflavisolibacter sp. H34]|uniref:polysaccharide lyase n=1 Tax=Huijunlia imazamoxiresistens TaxID=3127457 RepID=UPI003018D8F5